VVAGTERHKASARLSTRIGSVFGSMGKLEWAVVSCRLPLGGKLLLRAARAGQLEELSWLRARSCAWEPCTRVAGGSLLECGLGRASGRAAVGTRGCLPVE
jgi:hypothetical protein